jgi:hypothetical protein
MEIQGIAAMGSGLESGDEIHDHSAWTGNPVATKPGAAIYSLAARIFPKMTHKFRRRPWFISAFSSTLESSSVDFLD